MDAAMEPVSLKREAPEDEPVARDSKRAHHTAVTHDTIAQQPSPCRDATNVPRYIEPATHNHEQRYAQHTAAPAANGAASRQVYVVSHSTVPVSKLLSHGGKALSPQPAAGAFVPQRSQAAVQQRLPQHAAVAQAQPQQPAAAAAVGEANHGLRPRTGLRLTQRPEVTGQIVKKTHASGAHGGMSGWEVVARQAEIALAQRRAQAEQLVNPQAVSQCLGVEWDSATGQWTARFRSDTNQVHLGYYPTEDEAGVAYDAAAYLVNGRNAELNFPGVFMYLEPHEGPDTMAEVLGLDQADSMLAATLVELAAQGAGPAAAHAADYGTSGSHTEDLHCREALTYDYAPRDPRFAQPHHAAGPSHARPGHPHFAPQHHAVGPSHVRSKAAPKPTHVPKAAPKPTYVPKAAPKPAYAHQHGKAGPGKVAPAVAKPSKPARPAVAPLTVRVLPQRQGPAKAVTGTAGPSSHVPSQVHRPAVPVPSSGVASGPSSMPGSGHAQGPAAGPSNGSRELPGSSGQAAASHQSAAQAPPRTTGPHTRRNPGSGQETAATGAAVGAPAPQPLPLFRMPKKSTRPREAVKRKGHSAFWGVCLHKRTQVWVANIWVFNRQIALGDFEAEEDAALAYDAAAYLVHGSGAKLNFPDVFKPLTAEEGEAVATGVLKPGRLEKIKGVLEQVAELNARRAQAVAAQAAVPPRAQAAAGLAARPAAPAAVVQAVVPAARPALAQAARLAAPAAVVQAVVPVVGAAGRQAPPPASPAEPPQAYTTGDDYDTYNAYMGAQTDTYMDNQGQPDTDPAADHTTEHQAHTEGGDPGCMEQVACGDGGDHMEDRGHGEDAGAGAEQAQELSDRHSSPCPANHRPMQHEQHEAAAPPQYEHHQSPAPGYHPSPHHDPYPSPGHGSNPSPHHEQQYDHVPDYDHSPPASPSPSRNRSPSPLTDSSPSPHTPSSDVSVATSPAPVHRAEGYGSAAGRHSSPESDRSGENTPEEPYGDGRDHTQPCGNAGQVGAEAPAVVPAPMSLLQELFKPVAGK